MIGPDLYSFRALWRHYRNCRRNKRNTFNALAFEVDAEAKLLALQEELRAHSYRPGRSICFTTAGPKPREVFAADFRDRIVHHLLVSHQERVFEPIFIHDSFACRKDKGTLAASDRLMCFLRQVTVNGRRGASALKLDVASFFPSIHKATLDAILARHIRHPELLWLTRTLLFHDPTSHYRFRSLTPGALRSVVASYSGHLRHGRAKRDWEDAWDRHPWLGALFAREGWEVGERWPLPRIAQARRFQGQYGELVRRAGEGCLVFCQIGRFVEFRGPQRSLAERVLRLRSAHLPRGPYAFTTGFPLRWSGYYKRRAIEEGLTVVEVREGPAPLVSCCKARLPVAVLVCR